MSNTAEMKRISRFALFGAIGFGAGGAIAAWTQQMVGIQPFLFYIALIFMIPVWGALGGVGLGLALRNGHSRIIVLALLGGSGFSVGFVIAYFPAAALARQAPLLGDVISCTIWGVVLGAALGLALRNRKKITGLALAGALGFGLSALIFGFIIGIGRFHHTSEIPDIIWDMGWPGLTLTGIIWGASLGAAMGYLEKVEWFKRKALLTGALAILMMLGAGYGLPFFSESGEESPPPPPDAIPVTFPDSHLKDEVRWKIHAPRGLLYSRVTIYTFDLESITSLDAYSRGISNLTGLEYCANLEHLRLSDNNISDITPLADLTNLRTLYLNECQISGLSPLAGLTNLQSLSLVGNNISDLSPLAGLRNLESLWLENNNISGLSPLASLSNLERLSLAGNNISGLSPLAGLTNLSHLHLSLNQISDLSPLVSLTNLAYLSLGRNQISDISPLVENSGLGAGDYIWLKDNNLDLREGSEDMANIRALEDRGVMVTY